MQKIDCLSIILLIKKKMEFVFTPLFGDESKPYIRFKGKRKTDKFSYGCETVNDFNIDYINKKMYFNIYWQKPSNSVSNHISVVVYNNKLSQGGIKKMLKKIEMEQFQVKKILIDAEKQINYILLYIKFLSYNRRGIQIDAMKAKNAKYINELNIKFWSYMEHYEPLKAYFLKLPGFKNNYELLLNAFKTKTRCFECLQEKTKCGLVRQKKIMVCTGCAEQKIRKNMTVDCPVCLESFTGDKVILAGCGNSHSICNGCFYQLCKYTDKCPMCRGKL